MKNIWIDTDPGLDDTIAIIWALHNEKRLDWKIRGISTVKGNIEFNQTNINALAIVEHMNRTDIPVYSGAARPLLQKEVDATIHHGKKLGNIDPKPTISLQKTKSPMAMAEFLQSGEHLSLVTLGPLTNIAIFLRLYPEYISQIDQIVIMGGGTHGNITHFAEFNIYVDPEAAEMVFTSGIPIVMSGLDVTFDSCYFTMTELNDFLNSNSNCDPWLADIRDFYSKFNTENINMYDPTAMIAMAFPDKFDKFSSPVRVQLSEPARGMTLIPVQGSIDAPLSGDYTTQVLTSTDRKWFVEELFSAFLR